MVSPYAGAGASREAEDPVLWNDGKPGPNGDSRCGFTMIEVIVAIVILAFGLLGMAGTTAVVVRQVQLADIATERSAMLQSTLERLRAIPYDSVRTGSVSQGVFGVSWTVAAPTNQFKVVRVITTGPGMSTRSGGFPVLVYSVPDTFTYRILRP